MGRISLLENKLLELIRLSENFAKTADAKNINTGDVVKTLARYAKEINELKEELEFERQNLEAEEEWNRQNIFDEE